jgi:CheY-like chemotaxis protein
MATKVLIVDDDPLVHMLYSRPLIGAGYEVLTARDGVEALAMATRESPGLVLMDVMMAGMDGLSALRELKRTEATKQIPVIVITANVATHYATRREAQFSGAASFLTKPFSPAQLLTEVAKYAPPP